MYSHFIMPLYTLSHAMLSAWYLRGPWQWCRLWHRSLFRWSAQVQRLSGMKPLSQGWNQQDQGCSQHPRYDYRGKWLENWRGKIWQNYVRCLNDQLSSLVDLSIMGWSNPQFVLLKGTKIHVVRIEPTRRLGFSQKTHVELAYTELRIYWKSS